MASELLTPTIIAKEGLMQLENNLVAARMCYRAYEDEFGESKIGDTLTIRKPVKYAVRTGPVLQAQDATEGKTTINVDTQRGVDLRFPSKDLTLTIDRFADRYLKHPMIALANQVDLDVLSQYRFFWNYACNGGAYDATKKIGSYKDFIAGVQRLDDMSVPTPRNAVLSTEDYYGLTGSLTSNFFNEGITKEALTKNTLPTYANCDITPSNNIVTHVRGTAAGGTGTINVSPVANQTGNTMVKTYSSVKNDYKQTLKFTDISGTTTLKKGDVFTIAGVYAVNNVTKQTLPFLQQFVVLEDAQGTGTSTDHVDVTFAPPIIPADTAGIADKPYATVNTAPADSAEVNFAGGAGSSLRQNLMFHENAIALCMVPMELPEGAVKKARQSYKGFSIRVICDYDIINDMNVWRLDILYGVKTIYPDLGTRLVGSTA